MEELLLNPEGYPDFDYAPNLGREDAAEAMSLAHELMDSGAAADMSDALSTAWSVVKGEENPGGLTELELSPLSWLLVISGIGCVVWYGVKKEWPWQSWAKRQTSTAANKFVRRLPTGTTPPRTVTVPNPTLTVYRPPTQPTAGMASFHGAQVLRPGFQTPDGGWAETISVITV